MNRTDSQVTVHNFDENLQTLAKKFKTNTASAATISYKTSGVDITAGDDLVQRIKSFAKSQRFS
jgi:translation initiation factor 1 (eIF-1/SUI1)